MSRESRPNGSEIMFSSEYVIKHQAPEDGHMEYMRTTIGNQIADRTKKFFVPKIISFDKFSGEIVFERLYDIESLATVFRSDSIPEDLVSRIGEALATIHTIGKTCGESTDTATSQEVFLHGDFSLGNLHYCRSDDKLVILDWKVAHWLEHSSVSKLGSPSIDLAIFLISLFHGRAFSSNGMPRKKQIGEQFLRAYCEEQTGNFCLKNFESNLLSMITSYGTYFRARNSLFRTMAYYPSLIQLQRFVRKNL